MYRKPKYCCNCGDRVERIEWRFWNSSRFCELCETEYVFDEWWPRAAVLLIFVFGLTGFGFQLVEEPRRALESKSALVSPELRPRNEPPQTSSVLPSTSGSPASRRVRSVPPKEEVNSAENEPLRGRTALPPVSVEPVSYCGALTKKGKPCSRKVRGGGRCWQHKDKDSPEETN
ncbi:MAG: hypothetical protein HKN33_05190 [Pyrinomonadaceae bacterium]|nr:hypothetical protein [Pyrinomonadaceae bacterium]